MFMMVPISACTIYAANAQGRLAEIAVRGNKFSFYCWLIADYCHLTKSVMHL